MPARFSDLELAPALLTVVEELGYSQPTAVQAASIPALLAGRDLIGKSKTGSGKTAAFGLPILQRLDLKPRGLQALVLCPTRELSAQVAREVRRLGRRHPGLGVLELVGGQPIGPQLASLERGVHVVIGTPGRVLDHIGRGTLDMRRVKTVVLDEADRMLDMGFGPDVERVLKALPSPLQTALFSATFPEAIESLSARFLRDPVRVMVDEPRDAGPDIRQLRLDTDPEERFAALCWVLTQHPHESALIFCNYKTTVLELWRRLSSAGVSVGRLDGDLDQFDRDQVLARFRNQSLRLLVATDVAGRGLHVQDLDLVVNYELPQQPDVYVHRIGRTGRAGQRGLAISLTTARQDERIVGFEARTGVSLERLRREPGEGPGVGRLLASLARGPRMETLLISAGRKHKLRPGDILGALTGEAGGLQGSDIGTIEVQDRLTYVAVSRALAQHAVAQLNAGRIKGRKFRAALVGVVPTPPA
ncbi:MAG: ATP-dependent RNA helicase DbpA [Planctomycetota bacterium]|nr:MAG: ATP-dependent RNA helicase DbpA [Planctomycetota bacterium]